MNTTWKTTLRWISVLAVLVAGVFGVVSSAQAFEINEGGVIPEGEVIDDDVLIAGNNVVINGTVNGDVFAFGSTVTLNGVVNGSVFAGAQNVVMNGEVAGSLFVGASALDLGSDAVIGRNVLFGVFSMSAAQGSSVGRDVIGAGYQTMLAGEVERDVKVSVAALELAGTVGRNVEATVEGPGEAGQTPTFFGPPGAPPMIAPGIRVSSDAKIGGELSYTSSVAQPGSISAAPEGGIVYSTPQPGEAGRPAEPRGVDVGVFGWILDRVRTLITLLLLGGLALWLLPDLFNQLVEKARSQPAPATGWGFVTVIMGYIGAAFVAVLILAIGILFSVITLGGLAGTIFGVGFSGLAIVFAVFSLLVQYGSKVVIAFLGGRWILEKLAPQYAENKALPLLLGVVLYVLLRAIPFFGWLLSVFVTLLGLGAMWLLYRERRALAEAQA
jgi:cytoskeletal protein CcmA (bactofilin family)